MRDAPTAVGQAMRRNLRQGTMVLALGGIWLVFGILTSGLFLSPRNLSNLFLQTVAVGIVATGMTLVIVAGHIDLSVGAVAGFAGAVAAVLQVRHGWSTVPAIAAALAAGAAAGAWHGFWIAYRRVPAFVVTLASMLAFRGLILGVTGGQTVSPMHETFRAIGQMYLPPLVFPGARFNDTSLLVGAVAVGLWVVAALRRRAARVRYGFEVLPPALEAAKIGAVALALAGGVAILAFNRGIPVSVLLLAGVVLALDFTARNTVFGRHLYAVGAGAEAARLSGIDVRRGSSSSSSSSAPSPG